MRALSILSCSLPTEAAQLPSSGLDLEEGLRVSASI